MLFVFFAAFFFAFSFLDFLPTLGDVFFVQPYNVMAAFCVRSGFGQDFLQRLKELRFRERNTFRIDDGSLRMILFSGRFSSISTARVGAAVPLWLWERVGAGFVVRQSDR